MNQMEELIYRLREEANMVRGLTAFAGVYQALNDASDALLAAQSASVPVAGEFVGYLASGTLTRQNVHWHECKPLIVQPAASVPVVGEVVAYEVISNSGTRSLIRAALLERCPELRNPDVAYMPLHLAPAHSIPAAELEALRKDAERLRKCEAALVYVRIVLPMDTWADDGRRMIDAAIAGEKP